MYINNNKPEKMNGESSRIIVTDYIQYRLSKQGFRWENAPQMEGNPSQVQMTMRSLGDEFDARYRAQFEEMCNQLHVDPNTAYPTFHAIVSELFCDGVNWGRIVALFAFGGSLAVQCVRRDMAHLVDSIVDWVTTYVDHNLQEWIASHNGWEGFVEFYEQGPEARQESPWPSLRRIFGMGAAALGVLTLGAILTQRS